jgi:hypothetical protein
MTPKQSLIIWCLLGKQGQAYQSDIIPKLDRKDREALIAAGLIASEKHGQRFYLTVQDKGWHWASEHLREELPPNYRVLRDWLERIHLHLESRGETLAELIGPAPEHRWEPPASKKRTPSSPGRRANKSVRSKKPLSPTELRVRIEQAYLTATNGRKGEGVPLSRIRNELADLDRATVDAALLRILQGDGKARLVQNSDPTSLSEEDRAAAFSPGGEPFHLLWIQS